MDILAADIGGTNSRFAHFRAGVGRDLALVETVWLSTAAAPSATALLEDLVERGFSLDPREADAVVLAVAGPVEGGVRSSPPFIGWDINILKIKDALGIGRALLINDFVAQAWACRSPLAREAAQVLAGEPDPGGAVAVIGAGTGLGKAATFPDGRGGFVAVPSEGGHADFPFEGEEERGFESFLRRELKEDYVTANRVVSGGGLRLLHRFLTGEDIRPEDMAGRFAPGTKSLEWGARFYGRACRNYALEVLAAGGLYVAGGVAARMPGLVRDRAFEAEFRSSPTLGRVLRKIPVYLIANEESGLWGAACAGLQELSR
ncbi:MAG: glucokinase [Thermodesulfovibrionales bacterium]